MKIEQNIARLKYLLSLYGMTEDELLSDVNKGLKKEITKEDIFSNKIKINHLKRIDKFFNKGLHYYIDPSPIEKNKEASIFFRKTKFDTDLNIGAKKIVNQFEELKISLSAISKLSEIKIKRNLPIYKIEDNPLNISQEIRKILYPKFDSDLKEFLKNIIGKLAESNIYVFEFIETWNKKEKANIDGFFLNPNVIVLKRQQSAFRREIFTLAHELGHYLLNIEEVDSLDISNLANNDLTAIEKWCNDFAFYFLAGDFVQILYQLDQASSKNDYHHDIVKQISEKTHLSEIALFTRLLYNRKITSSDYKKIKADFEEKYRLKKQEEDKKKELDKQSGKKTGGSVPKAINSPLLISTVQTAYSDGFINEYDVCKLLNINPDKLNKYL